MSGSQQVSTRRMEEKGGGGGRKDGKKEGRKKKKKTRKKERKEGEEEKQVTGTKFGMTENKDEKNRYVLSNNGFQLPHKEWLELNIFYDPGFTSSHKSPCICNLIRHTPASPGRRSLGPLNATHAAREH